MKARTGQAVDVGTVAIIVVVASVVPVLIAWYFGALGVPRDDDWQYHRALLTLSNDGRLDLGTWTSMSLVGQLYLALPFAKLSGNSLAVAQLLVAAFGSVALVTVAVIAARCLPGVRRSWIVLIAVCPVFTTMWWPLAASFMTDIPAFALMMLCLAFGISSLGDHDEPLRWGQLGMALAIGFAGFTIREYAVVAPLAVLASAGLRLLSSGGRKRRVVLAGVGAAYLLALFAFYQWRHALGGFLLEPELPTLARFIGGFQTVPKYAALIGLGLLPIVAASRPRRVLAASWSAAPRAAMTVTTAWIVLIGYQAIVWFESGGDGTTLSLGTYFLVPGTLGDFVLEGQRGTLIPHWLFALIVAVGLTSSVLASFAIVARGAEVVRLVRSDAPEHAPVRPLLFTVAGYAAILFVVNAVNIPIYDRYIVPVLPLIAIAVAWALEPYAHGLGSVPTASKVAAAGLVVLALVYATDAAEFSGLRWRFASELATTAERSTIDGGFEWRGFWRGAHWSHDPPYCIVVRADAPEGADVVATRTARSLLRTETVVAIREKC